MPTVLMALPFAFQDGRDCYTGILQYLSERKYAWNTILVRESMTRPLLGRFLKCGIDGIISNAHQIENRLFRIIPRDMPCVIIDAPNPQLLSKHSKIAFVDIDSEAIGRIGAEYLAANANYGSFGIVGYESSVRWSECRIESFSGTLRSMGFKTSVLRVPRTNLYDDSVYAAIRRWATKLRRPTAIMAVCDELARQVINAFAAGGILIPQDVSVIGVDNESILCTHMKPTLSSIHPDFVKSGYTAAECMARILQSEASCNLYMKCPVKCIVSRESTAPTSAAGQLIIKAKEFIRDHAEGNVHVADVADHLGISRRLLDLRFREITGRTVLETICKEQLNRVQHLLTTTNLSITEISRQLGFRSENHLKRIFKSTYGMSMRDFRYARLT
jgi:LacI family transcriptional regulator